jgi:hypothetical protein
LAASPNHHSNKNRPLKKKKEKKQLKTASLKKPTPRQKKIKNKIPAVTPSSVQTRRTSGGVGARVLNII